ncbi:UNVERIFIED_CONTAM: hypothetical protein FKN15_033290 [Acipenser sinensis]
MERPPGHLTDLRYRIITAIHSIGNDWFSPQVAEGSIKKAIRCKDVKADYSSSAAVFW